MKWIKKYALFLMIFVSSLCYGTGKLLKAAENHQNDQNSPVASMPEEIPEPEKIGSGQESQGELEKGDNEPETAAPGEVDEPEAAGEPEIIEEPENAGEPGEVEQPEQKREFHRVELDYLDDALFIGDSRTSTLYEYAGWEQTDFFVKTGLTIWDVWERTMDGIYLEDVLAAKQYGKVYIMLGVNELGDGTAESFAEQFASVVARIREKQPEAIIFVESIMHVTAKKDAEGTYINNQEIDARNQEIQKLADNESIFWIDANEVMDEPGTGKLNGEYTFDGVHLKVKYIDVWQEFLLEHGI